MEPFLTNALMAFPDAGGNGFRCMAFDGTFYYGVLALQDGAWVYRYDAMLQLTGRFRVQRAYDSLAYDDSRLCFWGAVSGDYSRLYRLDRGLREMDRVQLERTSLGCGGVESVAANDRAERILVAFPDRIVAFHENGRADALILQEQGSRIFTQIAALGCRYALCALDGCGQTVSLLQAPSLETLWEQRLPVKYRVQSLFFDPGRAQLQALITHNRAYSFLLALEGGCTG